MEKIKISKKQAKKYAIIKRLENDKFEVRFDFIKIPIIMNASYLSQLLSKNQIIIKSIFSSNHNNKQRV